MMVSSFILGTFRISDSFSIAFPFKKSSLNPCSKFGTRVSSFLLPLPPSDPKNPASICLAFASLSKILFLTLASL
jgi:hypothetical protein